MDTAAHAARAGDVSVILSECPDIREPLEYFRWFDYPTIEEYDRALRADYTLAGWCVLITREYCRQSLPIMFTRPDNAPLARKAGLIPATTIDEAMKMAYDMCGKRDPSMTVMPNGANTLPYLANAEL